MLRQVRLTTSKVGALREHLVSYSENMAERHTQYGADLTFPDVASSSQPRLRAAQDVRWPTADVNQFQRHGARISTHLNLLPNLLLQLLLLRP